ncbi:chaplin family protein [Pseudomonas sp. NPDC089392]
MRQDEAPGVVSGGECAVTVQASVNACGGPFAVEVGAGLPRERAHTGTGG